MFLVLFIYNQAFDYVYDVSYIRLIMFSLMQNFMAEAASSSLNLAGGAISQGYNPFPTHGAVSTSQPSNVIEHLGPSAGGSYGSVYGSHSGY